MASRAEAKHPRQSRGQVERGKLALVTARHVLSVPALRWRWRIRGADIAMHVLEGTPRQFGVRLRITF